ARSILSQCGRRSHTPGTEGIHTLFIIQNTSKEKGYDCQQTYDLGRVARLQRQLLSGHVGLSGTTTRSSSTPSTSSPWMVTSYASYPSNFGRPTLTCSWGR